MKKVNNCNNKGMTLIELVVASAIFIIIMGGVSIFLSSGLKANEKLIERQSELNKARIASHYIINFLHSNDELGKINIMTNLTEGIDVISIDNEDGTYTYIFYSDTEGGLISATASEFNSNLQGNLISEIDNLEITKESLLDTLLVKFIITYETDKQTTNYVTLKAN